MSDRNYKFEFESGAPGLLENAITFGTITLVNEGLKEMTGVNSDGWYCRATDRETGLHATLWGHTKESAQKSAAAELDKRVERQAYDEAQQLKREKEEAQQASDHAAVKAKEQRYQSPQEPGGDMQQLLIKLVVGILVIAGIIWLVFSVVIPLLIINIALLALIIGFWKRDYGKYLFVLSIFGAIFLIIDYSQGWATKALPTNVSFFASLIIPFLYINLAAGLIGAYFAIQYYFPAQPTEGNAENSYKPDNARKRNYIVIGTLSLIFVAFILLQQFLILYVVKPIWTIADKFLGGVFTISKVPFSQI